MIQHATNNNNSKNADARIPWTVDGQVLHKSAYMDHIVSEFHTKNQDDDNDVDDPVLPRIVLDICPSPDRFRFIVSVVVEFNRNDIPSLSLIPPLACILVDRLDPFTRLVLVAADRCLFASCRCC